MPREQPRVLELLPPIRIHTRLSVLEPALLAHWPLPLPLSPPAKPVMVTFMVTFMVTYGDVHGEKSTWVIAKKVDIEEFFFF